jgi:hypothetical protein
VATRKSRFTIYEYRDSKIREHDPRTCPFQSHGELIPFYLNAGRGKERFVSCEYVVTRRSEGPGTILRLQVNELSELSETHAPFTPNTAQNAPFSLSTALDSSRRPGQPPSFSDVL